ncbi:putative methyltransferase-domain-containing protein [Crucibulum laeve]|uniref:Putative methyltransferase-domain-containing protein n=1 Tax=Crucibulum laeve TaxID=68775 RepID=A0A5C3M2E7_9AGAR|nr:putative methyltransferase-domain-containing protein [Crucibulum laeve]
MFYYISFLRPLPIQTPPFHSISIMPQISNDLRTESFPDEQELYFSWTPLKVPSGRTPPPTRPAKLTTWREANAYKEIPVPPPAGLKEGQEWRLVLSAQGMEGGNANFSSTIDLGIGSKIGKLPFPVLSMPVLFSAKGWKGRDKQEQIERIYRFPVIQSDGEKKEVGMKITEQTSFDLDKKIWDSGIGLSSWLVGLSTGEGHDDMRLDGLRDALLSRESRRIVELGEYSAGIGMPALTLSALRSGILSVEESLNEKMYTTDVSSAMPLLEHNISSNTHIFSNSKPKADVLDWDEEELPVYIKEMESIDAIIMADVTYNPASFPSLVRTIASLIKSSAKPPLVLLGYKERDVAERTLWDMAKEVGISFERVGERVGAGGREVEVWIGRGVSYVKDDTMDD